MIWGVYKDGLIHPIGPVPPEWTEGQRVVIESENEPSDDPAEIARWAEEVRTSGGIGDDDLERLQGALEEADRIAKDQMRREMGLDH